MALEEKGEITVWEMTPSQVKMRESEREKRKKERKKDCWGEERGGQSWRSEETPGER